MHHPRMALGSAARLPLTERLPDRAGAFQLHVHRDLHVWTWASAVAISADLRRDLLERPRSRLVVAGDPLARPVYEALARAPVDWTRVDVGLTDERWLRPDDPDSMAAQVRAALLRDHAAAARLETLTQPGRSLEEAVAVANAHAQQAANVVVLTLSEGNRLAGLFTGSADYARALESRQAYVALDATLDADAAPWPRRITATPAGLARAASRILLIRGDGQRAALGRAFEEGSTSALARLQAEATSPLQVHWCP